MKSPDLDITVAICTWNRADLLDQTLSQMRALDVPRDVQWELLVINNNSKGKKINLDYIYAVVEYNP